MLEIPESHTLADQITEVSKRKVIQNVTAAFTPHKFTWYFGDPAGYQELLSGKRIDFAKAYGGIVEISAEDTRILLQDGVNFRYLPAGEKLPKKHQLHIEFEDFTSLVATVQMYGGLYAYHDGENENPYYLTAKKKASPLSDSFDFSYFKSLYDNADPKLSAKAFLATEQRIPGLGNGVLQDILWHAKIHPKTRMRDLNTEQIEGLFSAVKNTLLEMTLKGGRNTERDLYGTPGGYTCVLSKNTLDTPCPDCSAPIEKAAYLGGSIYFCPHCQASG